MIGFGVDQAKTLFFDSKAVLSQTTKKERAALSKSGADVRKAAQKSILMGEGASPAGHPPHGHATGIRVRVSKKTGKKKIQKVSPLREHIYFVYEPATRSVIVGPVKLSGKLGDAPHALEFGGQSVINVFGKPKSVTISPHPFMGPALESQSPKAAGYWAD